MIYSIAQALAHDPAIDEQAPHPATRPRRARPPKVLRLTIDGRLLLYKSVDDFSFAIESRTSVPAERFHSLLARTPEELWTEAESIKSVEKNLVDILEDALCDARACGPAIQGLGLQIFSKDHDWRTLMQALNEQGDQYEGYKRLALIKYMQYLGARQEILRLIFKMKSTGRPPNNGVADASAEEMDIVETVLFDLNELGDSEPTEHPLQRLPQGEAVRAHALPGHAIEIRLAKYTFNIVNDDGWSLRDRDGHCYPLSARQNIVGRGSENDITLGRDYRNVSRRHLIMEPIDDHVILLTDISSHGTFAPPLQIEYCGI